MEAFGLMIIIITGFGILNFSLVDNEKFENLAKKIF